MIALVVFCLKNIGIRLVLRNSRTSIHKLTASNVLKLVENAKNNTEM